MWHFAPFKPFISEYYQVFFLGKLMLYFFPLEDACFAEFFCGIAFRSSQSLRWPIAIDLHLSCVSSIKTLWNLWNYCTSLYQICYLASALKGRRIEIVISRSSHPRGLILGVKINENLRQKMLLYTGKSIILSESFATNDYTARKPLQNLFKSTNFLILRWQSLSIGLYVSALALYIY